jgi:hypothetical protein
MSLLVAELTKCDSVTAEVNPPGGEDDRSTPPASDGRLQPEGDLLAREAKRG